MTEQKISYDFKFALEISAFLVTIVPKQLYAENNHWKKKILLS